MGGTRRAIEGEGAQLVSMPEIGRRCRLSLIK